MSYTPNQYNPDYLSPFDDEDEDCPRDEQEDPTPMFHGTAPAANFRPHAATLSAAVRGLQQQERLDIASYVEQDAFAAHEAEERAAGAEPLPIRPDAFVRITPFVSAVHAPARFGFVECVNEKVQYALVREGKARREWFSFEELTVDEAECVNAETAALEVAAEATSTSA